MAERDISDVIGSEMRRMDDRLVEQALAECRTRYEDDLINSRMHEVCDEAAQAREWTLLRYEREWREWAA